MSSLNDQPHDLGIVAFSAGTLERAVERALAGAAGCETDLDWLRLRAESLHGPHERQRVAIVASDPETFRHRAERLRAGFVEDDRREALARDGVYLTATDPDGEKLALVFGDGLELSEDALATAASVSSAAAQVRAHLEGEHEQRTGRPLGLFLGERTLSDEEPHGRESRAFAGTCVVAAMYRQWGLDVSALLGAGAGELTALWYGGSLSLDDAFALSLDLAQAPEGKSTALGRAFRTPSIEIFSCLTGRALSGVDPRELSGLWFAAPRGGKKLREAAEASHAAGGRVFLTCGASASLRQELADALRACGGRVADLGDEDFASEHCERALAFAFAQGNTELRRVLDAPLSTGTREKAPDASTPRPGRPTKTRGEELPTMILSRSGGQLRQRARRREAAPRMTREEVRELIVDKLATLSGYPKSELEHHLDLEGDLGIDTIKQVRAFSEVRMALALEVDMRFRLRRTRTIDAVTRYFWQRLLAAHSDEESLEAEEAPAVTAVEVERAMVSLLAEQLGYPTSMIDPQADLEADLGLTLDAKEALFSRVASSLGIAAPMPRRRDAETLRAAAVYFAKLKEEA